MLDSCEHVIDGAAAVAAALAGSQSRVQLLATSREPLAVAGELVMRVPPLDLDGPASGAVLGTGARGGSGPRTHGTGRRRRPRRWYAGSTACLWRWSWPQRSSAP